MSETQQLYLVTGGCGQLGTFIVDLLLKEKKKIRVLDLKKHPNDNIESIVGNVCIFQDVLKACKNVNTVFHTAAIVDESNKKLLHDVNVNGTKNVIKACKELGVKKLIFTSSFDVVMEGKKPMVNGTEELPYPKKYLDHGYSNSKREAEQEVIKANSASLATCILRPSGIYGPHDKYHLPPLLELVKKGKGIRIGNGKAKFSHAFSGNVAHAHVLASKHLEPNSKLAGQCYFIAEGDTGNLFDHLGEIMELLGYQQPTKSVPFWLVYAIGWICDIFRIKSNITRFSVVVTSIDRTVSFERARKDFGYEPIYDKEAAMKITANWFKEQGLGKNN